MSEILNNLSDSLAEIVETSGSSVVRVDARDRLAASGIVWSADGTVVTAHHVVERDDEITIGLPGGDKVPATLAGRDPTTDLAVLRTEANGLNPLSWVESAGPRVGNLVLALGRPGSSVQATMGIVGAVGPAWRTPAGGSVDRYLQSDTVMYPGFSGGPLVDASGRCLGLNTSGLLRGLSLALPTATVQRVVEAILSHGRVRRGYVGVGAQPTRLPDSLSQELAQETGLLLVSVEPGGPAEKAGMFLGDTIVTLDGQPVRRIDDLIGGLGSEQIGKDVTVRLIRGGQVMEVGLVPVEHS